MSNFGLGFVFFTMLLVGCTAQAPSNRHGRNRLESSIDSQTREWANHYFDLYARRTDWEAFLDCYSEAVIFEDQRINVELVGRKAFADFYNWKDPKFRRVNDRDLNLNIEELVVEARTAIARGTFSPFEWDGKRMNWTDEFVIWLAFDDNGKIEHQRDFIPYPKSLLPDQ